MAYSETAWVPMCVTDKAEWFWPRGIGERQKDVRENFAKHCCMEWAALRKEGWRIVRVRLTTELHQ